MSTTSKISDGIYQIHPDGCDVMAIRVRDGKMVDLAEGSMLDTFRASSNSRAEWLTAEGTPVDWDTQVALAEICDCHVDSIQAYEVSQ